MTTVTIRTTHRLRPRLQLRLVLQQLQLYLYSSSTPIA